MTTLTLASIHKTFDSIAALQGVDLKIDCGECVTLVGPSASGKTTLLRIIAGLDSPDQGAVLINGETMAEVPPHKRDVAMVFQEFPLYPHLSIADNIAFPLKVQNVSYSEMASAVSQIAQTLDLLALLKRKPHTLSGGQRQQVALARALVRSPKVLLLDEPLSHVDAEKRQQQRRWLHERLSETETAVLYVTHDQEEAMALGDRMAVLHEGVIQQEGHPLDIYQKPKNPFVAGFIGSPCMNIWKGTCKAIDDDLVFVTQGLAVPLPKQATNSSPPHVVGIRPEDLSLMQTKTDQRVLGQGTIASVEVLGLYSTVVVELPCGQVILAMPNIQALPKLGQDTTVWFDSASIHQWYDSD